MPSRSSNRSLFFTAFKRVPPKRLMYILESPTRLRFSESPTLTIKRIALRSLRGNRCFPCKNFKITKCFVNCPPPRWRRL